MPNTLFLSTILYYLIKKLWWNIIWPRKYNESEGFYLIPNFWVHSYLTISETKYLRAEQERMFSHLVSDSLHLHGLQHARLPCPSPSPGVWSNSCPLSQWCHSTISSSATPFSGLQSFPASGSLPVSRLFTLDGQSIETSSSASVLQMNIWGLFPLGLTGLISLKPKGLLGVFPTTTIWKPQFFSSQPSLWFNSHINTWLLGKQTFDYILTICAPPHSPAKKQTKQLLGVCIDFACYWYFQHIKPYLLLLFRFQTPSFLVAFRCSHETQPPSVLLPRNLLVLRLHLAFLQLPARHQK